MVGPPLAGLLIHIVAAHKEVSLLMASVALLQVITVNLTIARLVALVCKAHMYDHNKGNEDMSKVPHALTSAHPSHSKGGSTPLSAHTPGKQTKHLYKSEVIIVLCNDSNLEQLQLFMLEIFLFPPSFFLLEEKITNIKSWFICLSCNNRG